MALIAWHARPFETIRRPPGGWPMAEGLVHRQVIYRLRAGSRGKYARLDALVSACQSLWNISLADQEALYAAATLNGCKPPSPTFFTLGKTVKQLRRLYPWLAVQPFSVVRYALKYQADAWKAYFEKRSERPRFKSRHRDGSFTIPQNVRIKGGRLWVPKLGWYRLVGSNPYPDGDPVKVVVKQDLGRYYATVCYAIPEPERSDNGLAVGIDLNHAARAVAASSGEIVPFPDTSRLEARKRRYERVKSRRRKGSNRRKVARRRVAKAHRKLRGIRRDWQHQTSRRLARTAGQVCYEDLKVKNMTRKGRGKRGLNRENLRVGWAGLREKVEYKAAMPTAVNPAYTSLTCSECGERGDRDGERFECGSCGHRAHADLNAARNILAAGVRATGRRGALALATPTNRQSVSLEDAA